MTALDLPNVRSQHGNTIGNKDSIRKEKVEAEDEGVGIRAGTGSRKNRRDCSAQNMRGAGRAPGVPGRPLELEPFAVILAMRSWKKCENR